MISTRTGRAWPCFRITAMYVGLCCATFIAGCGAAVQDSGVGHLGVAAPQPALESNQSGNDTVDGLFAKGLFDCPGPAVLAKDPTAYTDAEIQEVVASFSSKSASTPTSVKSVPGSPIDFGDLDPCTASVNVTNVSKRQVQITAAGVENITAPVRNTYTYQEIDYCNLQEQGMIPSDVPLLCGRGAAPTCAYDLDLTLRDGTAGTDYTKGFSVDGCKTINLQPQASADISISIHSSDPLIYLVAPVLQVTDESGSHAIVFTHWTNNLVYASTSQFPCYTVQGSSFVLEHGKSYCTP